MSSEAYKVSILGPEEAAEVMRRLRFGPDNKGNRREAVLCDGFMLKGSFEMIAREVESGEVAWRHAAENLISDFGRRQWMDTRFSTMRIAFSPSSEPPIPGRCSISCDPTQPVVSGNIAPTNDPSTHTKTLTATYTTPAANRTLGMIGLVPSNVNVNTLGGVSYLAAYALLTPPKTQTTTQTLEVIYKISMNPIY